jgi:hypothetical protein
MTHRASIGSALIFGALVCAGLLGLGYLLADGIIRTKGLERTVVVKGLSEREVPADVAIWPIKFSAAGNDLEALYQEIARNNAVIIAFLREKGFADDEITRSAPAIIDRQAQPYQSDAGNGFRYTGSSRISVYSRDVERVRSSLDDLVALGKQGLVISGQDYEARTQFLFTDLNTLKPQMIEEATRNAREVALKFAADSESRLGKIRRANQGQFSIEDRDSNSPHIKRVRVVSTLEYYLVD